MKLLEPILHSFAPLWPFRVVATGRMLQLGRQSFQSVVSSLVALTGRVSCRLAVGIALLVSTLLLRSRVYPARSDAARRSVRISTLIVLGCIGLRPDERRSNRSRFDPDGGVVRAEPIRRQRIIVERRAAVARCGPPDVAAADDPDRFKLRLNPWFIQLS
jgi:hypothetical protein